MKLSILACVLVALTGTAAADVKIAVVDLNGALDASNAGKAAMADYQAKIDKKQKELDAQRADLKKQDDALKKQAGVLKPDVLVKKQQDLGAKVQAFQQAAMQADQELKQLEADAIDKISPKLEAALAAVAARGNYDLVIRKEAVAWAKAGAVDITKDVVTEVNKTK